MQSTTLLYIVVIIKKVTIKMIEIITTFVVVTKYETCVVNLLSTFYKINEKIRNMRNKEEKQTLCHMSRKNKALFFSSRRNVSFFCLIYSSD